MINSGNTTINEIYYQNHLIRKIYSCGGELVYEYETPPIPPTPQDYSSQYFTIDVISGNSIGWYSNDNIALDYSIDSGNTWTSISNSTISVQQGDKVLFKGNNSTTTSIGIGTFTSTSTTFNVYGNVMSLLYGDNFIGQTNLSYNIFRSLLSGSSVVSAENLVLPSTTLTYGCYSSMFQNCSSLTVAPQLPATTMGDYCYYNII